MAERINEANPDANAIIELNMSRRAMLQNSTSALAALGATIISTGASGAVSDVPARRGSRSARTRQFKAWIHHGLREGEKGRLEVLSLRPVTGRMVVVRTEAAQCCYSNAGMFMGLPGRAPRGGLFSPANGQAMILGHGGVGIVEQIGPEVRRVKPGDRVIVGVTPQCGECYNCVRGRADWCLALFAATEIPAIPVADTLDGVEVVQSTNIGGHAELMITPEEWCTAIDSKASAAELSLLSCVASAGLGSTTTIAPVEEGSDVVVFGAGPVGLSAIQGARIRRAARIIVVEPIRMRRELALRVGATAALDPNAEGDKLLERISDLCRGSSAEIFSGLHLSKPGAFGRGPDFVVQAVGGDRARPTVESGPDPTGILPLRQAWQICSVAGNLVTLAINQSGEISLPADQFALFGRFHHASNYGGTHLKRDVPRYARLIDQGAFDAKSLVTNVYPIERSSEAFQAVLDRTDVNAVIVY